MPILKTEAKKYNLKSMKNQIWLYLHKRKNPIKINTIKEFCACTYFQGGP